LRLSVWAFVASLIDTEGAARRRFCRASPRSSRAAIRAAIRCYIHDIVYIDIHPM
jgi:hypothetical protein